MSEGVDSEITSAGDRSFDEVYLRIWEQQQGSVRQRWVVLTVFLGISFGLFGLSLQQPSTPIAGTLERVTAVVIYWFAYLIYLQYSAWSRFLRTYLGTLESSQSTSIMLQKEWNDYASGARKHLTVKRLLLYFGLVYTVAVILLWWFGHYVFEALIPVATP